MIVSGANESPLTATVAEVSRSGVKLLIPSMMAVGDRATIELDRMTIDGMVRHCVDIQGGFEAGVEIVSVVDHSRDV